MRYSLRLAALALIAVILLPFFPASAEDNPQVEIVTNRGPILIELFPEKAPQTVANFLSYVDDGFYDGLIFHRVISGFMIQGGGYDQDLARRPTRDPIPLESDNGERHTPGTISMARTNDPNSATAQFFINLTNNPSLNYRGPNSPGYVVFGRALKGFSVIRDIGTTKTGPTGPFRDLPLEPVIIETVTRR